jgi:hypothetical protein
MGDFPVMEYKPMDCEEERIELASSEGELEFWDKIMRSPRQPMQRRMKAAELAAQYRYPKLAAVATGTMNGKDFGSMLERAILRSQVGEPLRRIEGPIVEHDADELKAKNGGAGR